MESISILFKLKGAIKPKLIDFFLGILSNIFLFFLVDNTSFFTTSVVDSFITTVVINGIFNTIFLDILFPLITGLYFLIKSIGTLYKLEIVYKVCFLLTLCSINSTLKLDSEFWFES